MWVQLTILDRLDHYSPGQQTACFEVLLKFSYAALYPFLFVAARVLYLAANNPGEFTVADLLLVLATLLLGTAAVYVVAALLLRGHGEGRLPALFTFASVALVFGAPALGAEPWRPPPVGFAITAVAALALLVVALAQRPAALRIGATFLTNTYALLVVWLGADILLDWRQAQQQITASALARELKRPIKGFIPPGEPAPSIYVIVLDEYANRATLRKVTGYDNGAFEDSLRALGFHVPRVVRSNYLHTYLSLASLLNASHVHRVGQELPPGSRNPTLVNHLVTRNRVARYLQDHGYRLIFFPSSWWLSTRWSPLADSVAQIEQNFNVGRSLSRTEFRRVLWQSTILAWVYREAQGDAEIVRATLNGVGQLASLPEPVFAFAHVLSPHRPYVLGSACGARTAVWYRDPPSYVAQLQCVNKLLLGMITRLIRESKVPPIIVLQGDHGTSFLEYSSAPSASQIDPEAAQERLGAFGAYFLPGKGAGAFGDSVSLVNVLGAIMREYFGADLPSEPDEHYLSIEKFPFEFFKLNPASPNATGLRSSSVRGSSTH